MTVVAACARVPRRGGPPSAASAAASETSVPAWTARRGRSEGERGYPRSDTAIVIFPILLVPLHRGCEGFDQAAFAASRVGCG